MAKTSEIATKQEQVELNTPNQILEFATSLKEMIVQNKLYTDIKGKNYVTLKAGRSPALLLELTQSWKKLSKSQLPTRMSTSIGRR